MKNLGPPKIDLTKLLSTPTVHTINGTTVDPIKLMNNVSMVSMKLNSDNVEEVNVPQVVTRMGRPHLIGILS